MARVVEVVTLEPSTTDGVGTEMHALRIELKSATLELLSLGESVDRLGESVDLLGDSVDALAALIAATKMRGSTNNVGVTHTLGFSMTPAGSSRCP